MTGPRFPDFSIDFRSLKNQVMLSLRCVLGATLLAQAAEAFMGGAPPALRPIGGTGIVGRKEGNVAGRSLLMPRWTRTERSTHKHSLTDKTKNKKPLKPSSNSSRPQPHTMQPPIPRITAVNPVSMSAGCPSHRRRPRQRTVASRSHSCLRRFQRSRTRTASPWPSA